MADRIVDANRFMLMASVVDWSAVQKRYPNGPPADELARQREISPRSVQLRWLMAPTLGYPTQPFEVWQRLSTKLDDEQSLPVKPVATPFGWTLYPLSAPVPSLRISLQVTSGAAEVTAYAGVPLFSPVIGFATATGTTTLFFSGPRILTLVVRGSATVTQLVGIDPAKAAADPSWKRIETVGLPVIPAEFAGVGKLDAKQGIEGALTAPIDAALDRYRRGAPLYGWQGSMGAGQVAPPWKLADPKAIVKSLETDVLGTLKTIFTTLSPQDQHTFESTGTLPLEASSETAATAYSPLESLVFAAATDPLVSLVAGFGTAYDFVSAVVGDQTITVDYMVTARYERGADGASDPVEYAAIVRAPKAALMPPSPALLAASNEGLSSPAETDQPWRPVVRFAWDKLPDSMPFRGASYAAARGIDPPTGAAAPLMGKRRFDDALQPISATTSPEREQATGRLRALDESFALPTAPSPVHLVYGVAHQDLFGLWSAWSTTPISVAEPPVQPVSIITTALEVTGPATIGGICPAQLVVDFSWDWANRSPRAVRFVARMYAQATRGDFPADLSVPPGFQKSLAGGPGTVFTVGFATNGTAMPDAGGSVQYLSADGTAVVAGPTSERAPRRYRLTIDGLALDFATTPHIGLAIWAAAIENLPPQRVGAWPSRPRVASASDPRPPVIVIEREDVLLASMPDAKGEHHAQLTWPLATGSTGYFIYTAAEEKLRSDHGMPPPSRAATLSERLAELRQLFGAHPDRRFFTRLFETPIPGPSVGITIPRGSKEIHLYLVIGVSAGGVESPWPDALDPKCGKRPIAYAAPQLAVPAPPSLEVARVLVGPAGAQTYKARIRITTRPGVAVSRIDLHRVRVPEAAHAIDTMGPPIARITGPSADWTVTPLAGAAPGESQALGILGGDDSVPGSWKPVFYRAVAWSSEIPERGIHGGRSPASAAIETLIPPSDPPDLSPLAFTWAGGPITDILVSATTTAPVAATPLGPHRVRAEAYAVKADGTSALLYAYPPTVGGKLADNSLDHVPTTAASPGTAALWLVPGAPASQLRLLLPRASLDDALRVRLELADPLGRVSERALLVPAGSPLPDPTIDNPRLVKVAGKGFVLGFSTSVPVQAAPVTYTLRVQYRTLLPGPLPHPGPPIVVTRALFDIATIQPGEDPFAEATPIPLRRQRATPAGTTLVAIYLRGQGGQVALTLSSPDGRTATLTQGVH